MTKQEQAARRSQAAGIVVAVPIGAAPLVATAGRSPGRATAVRRYEVGPGVVNHPVGVVPSASIRIPDGWRA